MAIRFIAWITAVVLASIPLRGAAAQPVVFTAADGVRVYATFSPSQAAKTTKGVILLFHMARSNYGEYESIIPTLVAHGYDCLAIDQRSGAPAWGRDNETVKRNGGDPTPFLDALPDVEAALAWAKANVPGTSIILWGSSYSASLAFLLAARHPHDVAALVAFSPGEYFKDDSIVHQAAARIRLPIFVDSASSDREESVAASILAASPSERKVQYRPHEGTHGSSTLRVDADPRGAAENWNALLSFLDALGNQ